MRSRVRGSLATPARGRVRAVRFAAALAGLSLAAAGCGVQSTEVHVTGTMPYSASGPSAVPSSSRGAYRVHIFLVQSGSHQLVPVTRYLDAPPTDMSILAELRKDPTADEQSNGYENEVPCNLDLQPTQKLAHQYFFSGPLDRNWTTPAQLQIVCSLDVHWLLNPEPGLAPSTQLLVNGINAKFDDCPDYATWVAGLPLTDDGLNPLTGKVLPPGVAQKPSAGVTGAKNP